MNIEALQHYMKEVLPEIISNVYLSLDHLLHSLPPLLFIMLSVICAAGFLTIQRRYWRHGRREQLKQNYFRDVSGMSSLQEMIPALNAYFKKIEPDILSLGIYLKEANGFRLSNNDVSITGKRTDEDGSSLETNLLTVEPYAMRGRFHTYTFIPKSAKTAIKIISYNKINIEQLHTELYYFTAFLENFIKGSNLNSDLVKSKLVEESKSIFTSFLSNQKDYFELVGTIILSAYRLDTVQLLFNDGASVLGKKDFIPNTGKLLYVRNTDIKVQIYRTSGITQEDIINTGKFLDLISATLAMYSSEAHITNYISFLEASTRVYEEREACDHRHSDKVGAVALFICNELDFEENRRTALSYACKFHDIGMMGALCDIASKNITISEKEYSRIKYHSIIGYTITKPLDSAYPISAIILQHHEFLDGTGYPEGLLSEYISLDAKILSLSEVFVGMMSDRPHRKGRTYDDALRELKTMIPHKLDKSVFDALIANSDKIRYALEQIENSTIV